MRYYPIASDKKTITYQMYVSTLGEATAKKINHCLPPQDVFLDGSRCLTSGHYKAVQALLFALSKFIFIIFIGVSHQDQLPNWQEISHSDGNECVCQAVQKNVSTLFVICNREIKKLLKWYLKDLDLYTLTKMHICPQHDLNQVDDNFFGYQPLL